MMRWAKITSDAYKAAQNHKQVLIGGKTHHKQYKSSCKMEMCNGILKTNREQHRDKGAAWGNTDQIKKTLKEEMQKSKMGNVAHQRM